MRLMSPWTQKAAISPSEGATTLKIRIEDKTKKVT